MIRCVKWLTSINGGRSETDYMSDKQFESLLLRFEREREKFSAQNTSLAATTITNNSNSSTLLNKKKFNENLPLYDFIKTGEC